MSFLNKTLEELGLSDKEAKVYLACLELGASPVQKISSLSGINRVTTYVILECLSKKGLVSETQRDKKTLFIAEDPENLSILLEKIREEVEEKNKILKKAMPELKSLIQLAGKKPIVKIYEGKSGLIALQQEYMKAMKKDEKMCSFVPIDYLHEVFLPEEGLKPKRLKKRVSIRIIYNSKKGDIDKNDPAALKETRRVPIEKFPFKSGMDIYGKNRVAIINYKDKLMGISIESKELHDTFKIIFELAWEAADKYQSKE